LKELHREVGITFVYVTHDQEEALTMSDRLAVMRAGEIEQVGPPQAVYDAPESAYVADFLGLANLLPASVSGDGVVDVLGRSVAASTGDVRGECTMFARPERIGLCDVADGMLTGTVSNVVFVGSTTHVRVDIDGHELQTVLSNDGTAWVPVPGTEVGVVMPTDSIRLLAR
jgi:spermidine/putrescine transport system ATP-binding protein